MATAKLIYTHNYQRLRLSNTGGLRLLAGSSGIFGSKTPSLTPDGHYYSITGWVGLNIHYSANRGQVGIGTLIVFIAMVLVAAIAAGVLINTAGLLQAQAQQTGAEATAEVSDILEIGTVVGEASTSTPANITAINASLRLGAGADPINASEASYTLANADNATIVNGANGTDGVEFVKRNGVKSGSDTLSDQSDFIVVQFNLTEISGVQPVEAGSQITIITESPAGGQSYTQARAPKLIEPDGSYIL